MLEYYFDYVKKYKIVIGISISIITALMIISLIIFNWTIECQNLEQLIVIPKGASASSVAVLLQENECFEDVNVFKLGLMMSMKTKKIRPGRYDFKGIASMRQLIRNITSQPGDLVKVTLIEGWSVEQMANELHANLKIDSLKFNRLSHDLSFITGLGINSYSLEGYLFPETYFFLKYYTEKEIIEVLVRQFKKNYQNLIKKSIIKPNLSMEDIVVLASIIQGEAMHTDEMAKISSVYHNRLRKNMLLQADPTIQYLIPGKPRRLFNKDLKVDSPYNTYLYKGLPPGAINNPGKEALKAAMSPEKTDYLYFVSNGEGRHVFTQTIEEHNLAKLKLKQKRRNIKNNEF